MSDSKLRALERRWREQGRPEAEAALLRERVRTGSLPLERLQLAAFCGHEAASTLVPTDELPQVRGQGLQPWLKALASRWPKPAVLAVLALIDRAPPDLTASSAPLVESVQALVRSAVGGVHDRAALWKAYTDLEECITGVLTDEEESVIGALQHLVSALMAWSNPQAAWQETTGQLDTDLSIAIDLVAWIARDGDAPHIRRQVAAHGLQ